MRTYQHSGIVPPTGALLALAAGCAVAPFLGVAYSFSFYYIPFVYLNFLLACGLALMTAAENYSAIRVSIQKKFRG